MSGIKTNEREISGKIAEWLNERIAVGGYPFTEATNETGIKVDEKTRFGDIVIWKNRENKEAFSYIEIKPPFGAKENLETFRLKAVKLNVKYAFTWDFQNLNIFIIKGNEIHAHDLVVRPLLNNLDEWLRGDKQAEIRGFINWLCDEIEKLNQTGKLSRFNPEKVFFINLIRETKDKLIPEFERFIKEQRRKSTNKDLIDKYVVEQGISMPNDEAYFKIIASQRVYGLITKIVFYLTIRRYFKDLPDLSDSEEPDLNRAIQIAFAKAAEKDWQAVFLPDPIEELGIPKEAEEYLKKFFEELEVYHFSSLKEDVIGELFEEIIEKKDRHRLGQYFTREDLVDFVIATVVNDYEGIYADPTCGSGTFLIRLYDRLKYLRPQLKHTDRLDKIWGIDIGKFPAELSTINLFRQDAQNFENFPRVLHKNIFDIHKGFITEFPPPNAGRNYQKIKKTLPEFNALVGNFPYIRQELIEKKDKGFKDELTVLLAEEYLLTYPSLFEMKKEVKEFLLHFKEYEEKKRKKLLVDWVNKKFLQLKLSGQADIYAYIFIHTATLLAKSGQFAIITSNSWLDVAYGSVLKQFFLDHFNVKMVVASWAEPWFEDAAVNTIITVLEKKNLDDKKENLTRFVKLKKKFEELIPYRDLQIESMKRWQRIDALIREIESAENLKKCRNVTHSIKSYETDEMRIRLVQQSELVNEVNTKGEMSKWGKYLRAPDVYFELIEECKDKLVPLKTVADVRFGIKTGINEFFYLEKIREDKSGNVIYRNDRGWEGIIEEKYLKKVIKSPKEAESIIIDPDKLKFHIFICNHDKKELKKQHDLHALKYIEWGESQKTKEGINWDKVPSVSGRGNWYTISENKPGFILLQMINNERFIAFLNIDSVQVDHNLFEFLIEDKKMLDTAEKYLNSYLFALIKEVNSRVNLGDGATKTEGIDWNNLMLIPNKPLKIKFSDKKFFSRKALSCFEEVKQKDRKVLDTAVLEALGLDPKKWLPRIYDGLCEMVKERLELPKMRKKQKKEKEQFSYDEVKRSVVKDLIPKKGIDFPGRFYTSGKDFSKLEFETYDNLNRPLRLEHFMGNYNVINETGDIVLETNSESKAKYLLITASRKNTVTVKIPGDEKICNDIIKAYVLYIKELESGLTVNAKMKLHDVLLAEKMAKEILTENELIYNFE